MKIIKENVVKLIDALGTCGKRNIVLSDGSIVSVNKYSFEEFGYTHGLFDDNTTWALDEVRIPCPFHKDESPSMSFNVRRNVWHCFSCGCGGSNIVSFYSEYDKQVLGMNTDYYATLNNVLATDPELQAKLDFRTIYDRKTKFDLNSIKFNRFKMKDIRYTPSNYLELSSIMKKRGCDEKQITFAILLMQDGMLAKDIYKQLFENDNNMDSFETSSTIWDLEEALKEEVS